MLVLRSTMERKLKEQQEDFVRRLSEVSKDFGQCLHQCTSLQKELSAWIMNKTDNITPEQFAQMFWEQDGRWQALFFNAMQDVATASYEAQPKKHPLEFRWPLGVPAGEGQWYHMCEHLDDKGWETMEAMFEHAKHWREKQRDNSALAG
jgi:hypothetical protein